MTYQTGAVFFVSLVEFLCYSLYIRFIPARLDGWRRMFYAVGSIGCLFAINLIFFNNLGYPTALLYYSFLFLWMLAGRRMPVRAAFFHLLILFMADHCLKQVFSNMIWGSFWAYSPTVTTSPGWMLTIQIGIWAAYGVVLALLLWRIGGLVQQMDPRHLTWTRIAWMIPAVIPVLYISYLTISLTRNPTVTEMLIEGVCSFCGLVLIISQERMHLANIYRLEIAELENAMRNQYERYLVSTEAAGQINQACHDIKNQLIAFRQQEHSADQAGYFAEMEKTISKYQSVYHTGNGVLDGLLYEKGKRAGEIGAQLLCFADGALLDHLRPVDLCTLVGNLLDNAIEASEKISNPADRTVILKVTEFRGYTLLRCENGTAGPVLAEGSDFRSTKTDGRLHGFGLKGVKHVVGEYEGEMTIDSEDGRFVVSILLPAGQH